MAFAEGERKMLSDLCTNIVNYRATNIDLWVNDPQSLLITIQSMVAQYAEDRYKAMLLKKSEFEFSEAMLHSAIQSEKGMLQ